MAMQDPSRSRQCPGCGLRMPADPAAAYDGYFNTSPECWGLFAEVCGEEFSNAVLFGQTHQLTVDTYAVQHAGGVHPDKSVAVHLAGLYLTLVRQHRPATVAPLQQRLANRIKSWPHFPLPENRGPLTIFEVAYTSSFRQRVDIVRRWASQVWMAWTAHHARIETLIARHLDGQ